MPENREILIIKNITREGPGLLGDLLREMEINYKIIDLRKGEEPGNIEEYSAVIILGGPDSANDDTPGMKRELALVRDVLAAGIPYLGICLGLQVMVRAAGGQVAECAVNEIGFRDQEGQLYSIGLTESGRKDPLFDGIDHIFNVFHLHGETVILTENMLLLAEGSSCRNQIVKTGLNAYGIQCHCELTHEMLNTWITEDPDLQKLDNAQMQADFLALGIQYSETGRQIFKNFVRIAGLI